MKVNFQKLLFVLFSLFAGVQSTIADPPGPPPPPGGGPGGTGGVPVGAPIDDGVFVLILLAAFYGCYKIYEFRKNRKKAAAEVSSH